MKKLFLFLCFLLLINIGNVSAITVDSFVTADDVTITHLETFRSTVVDAINSASGANLVNQSVTAAKLDANANPENRWDEAFNDFVYTGLLPTTTSGTLSTTTSAGTAYINGTRVVKAATNHTYTASRYTFLDLSDSGTYTYQEVTFGAVEPATSLNSIRLARVSSDTTEINQVRDDRTTTLISIAATTKIIDLDGDTQIQTEESSDEDILRFDTAGIERATLAASGFTLNQNLIFEGTVNDFETTFAITDPTADRTITVQNNSGVLPLTTTSYTSFITISADTTVSIPAAGTLSAYESDSSYLGSFTKNTSDASGTQVITGVGFRPARVTFISADNDDGSPGASIGFDTAYSQGCVYDLFAVAANTWGVSGTFSIHTRPTVAANFYTGEISSMDSDGFTITWTRTGAPTKTIEVYFIADRFN